MKNVLLLISFIFSSLSYSQIVINKYEKVKLNVVKSFFTEIASLEKTGEHDYRITLLASTPKSDSCLCEKRKEFEFNFKANLNELEELKDYFISKINEKKPIDFDVVLGKDTMRVIFIRNFLEDYIEIHRIVDGQVEDISIPLSREEILKLFEKLE